METTTLRGLLGEPRADRAFVADGAADILVESTRVSQPSGAPAHAVEVGQQPSGDPLSYRRSSPTEVCTRLISCPFWACNSRCEIFHWPRHEPFWFDDRRPC